MSIMKKITPIIFGIFLLTACLFLTGSAAAYTWYSYGGSEYSLTEETGSWTDAEAEAVDQRGHLVAINSQAEQDFLMNQFGDNDNFWIGFNDAAVEGSWVWSNGDPVTYTNWEPGEPNDASSGGEDMQ